VQCQLYHHREGRECGSGHEDNAMKNVEKEKVAAKHGLTSFNIHHERYEEWFARHEAAYLSELLAVRALLPWQGLGLEIGVGTARFAAPLGVKVGVDPSMTMLAYAVKRGVVGVQGIAECLPFKDGIYDFALVVTTICFVANSRSMLMEARRVLKLGAPLVIGFVDRESELGQQYLLQQAENVFYREARFYSAWEVAELLEDTGYVIQTWLQTLSKPLNEIVEMEPFHKGYGNGGFVVVSAMTSSL
jgi:SAM-dependent methyltransferase